MNLFTTFLFCFIDVLWWCCVPAQLDSTSSKTKQNRFVFLFMAFDEGHDGMRQKKALPWYFFSLLVLCKKLSNSTL